MFVTELYDGPAKQIKVIYPGRFQPFHKGHAQVYQYLCQKYGKDNVYIVTSDRVEMPKSPFNFAEKKQMMLLTGISGDKIVMDSQPYRAQELVAQFDTKSTILLFAVSEKDMAEDPRFQFKPKKDGSPSYFQQFSDIKQCETLDKHAYMMTVPTFDFTVLGKPATSASEIRAQFAGSDLATQRKIVTDLFGKFDNNVFNIMKARLESTVTEEVVTEFAPAGSGDSGDDGFDPGLAKMATDEGNVMGASLHDGATLEAAFRISHWDGAFDGIYKHHFADGFKVGRLDKIRHNNRQYNTNLKLMKDGSVKEGVTEADSNDDSWETFWKNVRADIDSQNRHRLEKRKASLLKRGHTKAAQKIDDVIKKYWSGNKESVTELSPATHAAHAEKRSPQIIPTLMKDIKKGAKMGRAVAKSMAKVKAAKAGEPNVFTEETNSQEMARLKQQLKKETNPDKKEAIQLNIRKLKGEIELRARDKVRESVLDAKTLSPKALADLHKVPTEQIIEQLKKGIAVEQEHTSDRKIASEIALDHIKEDPQYYDKLATVEEGVKINESSAQIRETNKLVELLRSYGYDAVRHVPFYSKIRVYDGNDTKFINNTEVPAFLAKNGRVDWRKNQSMQGALVGESVVREENDLLNPDPKIRALATAITKMQQQLQVINSSEGLEEGNKHNKLLRKKADTQLGKDTIKKNPTNFVPGSNPLKVGRAEQKVKETIVPGFGDMRPEQVKKEVAGLTAEMLKYARDGNMRAVAEYMKKLQPFVDVAKAEITESVDKAMRTVRRNAI